MAGPQEPLPSEPRSARDRLLAAAVASAMQGGIADLSLRELAAVIGTSHRMLLYHFGSREGLLAAVTLAVEAAERATLADVGAVGADDARRFWARYSDPRLWPQERLFFELYVHALRGRPGTEGFLDHVVTGWLEPLTAAIASGGTEPADRADGRAAEHGRYPRAAARFARHPRHRRRHRGVRAVPPARRGHYRRAGQRVAAGRAGAAGRGRRA